METKNRRQKENKLKPLKETKTIIKPIIKEEKGRK